MPGVSDCPTNCIDPIDGWPIDPLICVRKVAALSDLTMHKAALKVFSGNLVEYSEVVELEQQIKGIEDSLPERFQVVISPDGRSIEPMIHSDPFTRMLCMFLCGRLSISRTRLHRLFIIPKPGIPAHERQRHLDELLSRARQHFLVIYHFPHSLNMHPLMLISLLNTAIAAALVFLKAQELDESTAELDFFMPEFEKMIQLFELGQKTIASSLARKSMAMLTALVEKIKAGEEARQLIGPGRQKKGHGVRANRQSQRQLALSESGGAEEEVKRKTKNRPQPNLGNSPDPRPDLGHKLPLRQPLATFQAEKDADMDGYHVPSRSQSLSIPNRLPGDDVLSRSQVDHWRDYRPVAELPPRGTSNVSTKFGVKSTDTDGYQFLFNQTPSTFLAPSFSTHASVLPDSVWSDNLSDGLSSWTHDIHLPHSKRSSINPEGTPAWNRPETGLAMSYNQFRVQEEHGLNLFDGDCLSRIGMSSTRERNGNGNEVYITANQLKSDGRYQDNADCLGGSRLDQYNHSQFDDGFPSLHSVGPISVRDASAQRR